jgi:hypothetical protein
MESLAHPHRILRQHFSRVFYVTMLLLFILFVSCDRAVTHPVEQSYTQEFSMYVTGEAAQSLDEAGRFPVMTASGSLGSAIISERRAGELAVAYVRGFGEFFRERWAREHGRYFDLESLRVDHRIQFLPTAYEEFPAGYMPAYRKFFGPYYLVTLVSGSSPVLLVAVSAYSTDVGIDKFGKAAIPGGGNGGEFSSYGITHSPGGMGPLLSEWAVVIAGKRLGARTSRVPELVRPLDPVSPLDPLWRLELDRDVLLKTKMGGKQVAAREVFVSRGGRFFVPSE